jgi:hypothetical protein
VSVGHSGNPTSNHKLTKYKERFGKTFIWPCSSINLYHKNFDLLVRIARMNPSMTFIVPSSVSRVSLPENLIFVGKQPRDELLAHIAESDGVLITSIYETVCIPIFEALSFSRNAIVLSRPYVDGIKEMFPDLNGVLEFKSEHDFYKVAQNVTPNVKNKNLDTVKCSNWNF